MFACNIFGSEGSYLIGEVWVKKAEAVIFLIPRKKEFSKLLSSGFAFYCLRDTSCPPAHSLISCWPVSATGSLAWLLFSYYQVSTISPKPPLTKAVFPPHLLLCSICHRWPLPFFFLKKFSSLFIRGNITLILLWYFLSSLLSHSLAPSLCPLSKMTFIDSLTFTRKNPKPELYFCPTRLFTVWP